MHSFMLLGLLILVGVVALFIFYLVLLGFTLEVIGRFRNWFIRLRERRIVSRELNAMSDRELQDIGLSRSDISRVVQDL